MNIRCLFSRQNIVIAALAAGGLIGGSLFAYEPVTRNVVSRDALCTYCHMEREYVPTLLVSEAKPHPRTPGGGQARCIDCHLPEGFWSATFAYSHYASLTDLFGHVRDLDSERAAEWIPPRAATAHRVRDRLFEYDSVTCRSCHVQSKIAPKSHRGQMAHRKAESERQTCIQCHYNMAHHQVGLRVGTFLNPNPDRSDGEFDMLEFEFDMTLYPSNSVTR